MGHYTKFLVPTILALASVALVASCEKKIANPLDDPKPAIENTVFVAKPTAGPASMSAPVVGNYTNETPPRYTARHGFGNGLEVGYQYVGKGVTGESDICDVYLVSVKIGDEPAEYQAVYYEGGDKLVFDRPEVKISLQQGDLS
jgi:hypothetical protein